MSEGKPERRERKDDGPRPPNPRMIALKKAQAPLSEQRRKNYERIEQLKAEAQALQKAREGKFVPVNKEDREVFMKLNGEIGEKMKRQKQIQLLLTDLMEKSKAARQKLPKNFKNVEQIRDEIEQQTYILEHGSFTVPKEKEIKASIAALEKLVHTMPDALKDEEEIQKLRDEQRALRNELDVQLKLKNELIEKQQKDNATVHAANMESTDIRKQVDEKYAQMKALFTLNEDLQKQSDELYQAFLKEEEVHRQEQAAIRAKQDARKLALPVLDKLDEVGVRVYEKERFSGDFEVTLPGPAFDPLAQSKGALMAWLMTQLSAEKVVEIQQKEMTKDEKKRARQAANRMVAVDITADCWLSDFGLKPADVATKEQKQAMLTKLMNQGNEEREKQQTERDTKINELIEELKKFGTVTIKTRAERDEEIKNYEKKDFKKFEKK